MKALVRWVVRWAGGNLLAFLTLVALFSALGAPASAAAPWPTPPAPEELRRMSEVEALATLQRVYRAQQALRGQRQASRLDTTPPVLTRFDAGPDLTVSRQLATVRARFEASDDMSGVYSIYALAEVANGIGKLEVRYRAPLPKKQLKGVMNSRTSGLDLMQPGSYTFAYAYVADYAGNLAVYDRAALSALGDTTLELRNPQGFDTSAPTLISGVVLTPEVALSDHHPGTDQPPYIAVRLSAEDSGGTVIAGLRNSSAWFCLREVVPWECLPPLLNNQMVTKQSSALLTLASQLGDVKPGEYHLRSISLNDFADSGRGYFSLDFGGDTDFSRYFPSTTITVTPGTTPASRAARKATSTSTAPPQSQWLPGDPNRVSSPELATSLQRARQEIQARRAQGLAGPTDVTAPVLVRFEAEPELNVNGQLATPRVHFEAMDDESGIIGIWAEAARSKIGSGGWTALYLPGLPARHLDGLLADGGVPKGLQAPGTYTFVSATLYDAAGNIAFYDADQLAALGNTAIKVRNSRGYDLKPPKLVSGMILTPEISLSGHQPGTNGLPKVGLKLGVEDHGNPKTSGLELAIVWLCTLGPTKWCIRIYAADTEVPYQSSGQYIVAGYPVNDGCPPSCMDAPARPELPHQSSAKFVMAGEAASNAALLPPGEYHLCSVSLKDVVGNFMSYASAECRGDTDFSRYFPSVVITLRP
jgi:hypothetical protein